MLERSDEGDGVVKWSSARGTLRVDWRSKRVVLFTEVGFLEGAFASVIHDELDQRLAMGVRPAIFVDAFDLQAYDSAIRVEATEWLKQHRDDVECQHMLVRSSLTKMGFSVASLALGSVLVGHTTRATFQTELDRALAA